MLTAQIIKSMDDEHLLASARAEIDPLTSTPLELELLDRFERLLDGQHDNEGLRALTEEYDLTADDFRAVIESHPASLRDKAALLSLLDGRGIHQPHQLKALLDIADEFRALANDAGDFLIRLHNFIDNHKE